MPMINLLPWREELRQKRKKEFGLAALGAVLMAAAITFGTKVYYQQLIASQEDRNTMLRNEIAELDRQIEEINQLDAQKSRLLARMEIIEQLQRSRPEAVHLMDELVEILPPGVHYTQVRQQGTMITVNGVTQANARISDLMREVDLSAWLDRPNLGTIVTQGTGPTREGEFRLEFNQVRMAAEEAEL